MVYPRRPYFLLLISFLLLSACSSELDPMEPDGAYLLFRQALLDGDQETIWSGCDKSTHDYFQTRYDSLKAMDEDIIRYLPQADHRIAKRQSGVILTREIKDGKGLFMKVFQPDALPKTEAIALGSEIEEINLSKDEKSALVITRAAQKFYLTRESADARWFVMLPKSVPEAAAAMKWVEENQQALRQTVDDLISEERTEREVIIGELMKM